MTWDARRSRRHVVPLIALHLQHVRPERREVGLAKAALFGQSQEPKPGDVEIPPRLGGIRIDGDLVGAHNHRVALVDVVDAAAGRPVPHQHPVGVEHRERGPRERRQVYDALVDALMQAASIAADDVVTWFAF